MTFEAFCASMKGRLVAVLGIGVSNRPLIRLLRTAGAEVVARDRKEAAALGDILPELSALGVRCVLGEGYLDGLDEEIIFRTPGMRPDLPPIAAARAAGSILTSEMEAFFSVCPCPILAVTGSNGKTTTTTVIAEFLRRAGRTVHLGGNIGRPLLAETPRIGETDVAVVELSSFQLMTMRQSPHIAVVTNINPNHLDVHRDMAEYIGAKRQICLHQRPGDVLVLNADCPVTRGFAADAAGELRLFSRQSAPENGCYFDGETVYKLQNGRPEPLLRREDILLPGAHNVENYMAAIAAARGLVRREDILETARSFAGVPHRLEKLGERGGVTYYNDSMGTSPSRTAAGLRSFEQKVILIAGGYDKQIPFDELGPEIVARAKVLALYGATADKIRAAVEAAPGYDPSALPVYQHHAFADAVHTAMAAAGPGDIVLMSPACAAFDQFENYAHRSRVFRELVEGR